jgi:nitroreductase
MSQREPSQREPSQREPSHHEPSHHEPSHHEPSHHEPSRAELLTDSERVKAVRFAVERALRAPSVHNTQPWLFETDGTTVRLRADRTRQLTALDPRGRELAQSLGAALLNLRVALAARSWRAVVERLPDPADPDLFAVVQVVPGRPETDLADLDPAISRRRTNRRRFEPEPVPDALLRRLATVAAEEQTHLVPVVTDDHRRLVARLTQQADAWQNADPAYRAELRRWTTRSERDRDGVPRSVVPRVDGGAHDEVPLRDFDTTGEAQLPGETGSGVRQTLVLLTTPADDPLSWLRSGEAMERVLLELTQEGFVAGPLTQPIEVALTRSQLRSALSWGTHPQMLLRIGRAAGTPRTARRPSGEVLHDTGPREPAGTPPAGAPVAPSDRPVGPVPPRRPMPDGRGGTVWI